MIWPKYLEDKTKNKKQWHNMLHINALDFFFFHFCFDWLNFNDFMPADLVIMCLIMNELFAFSVKLCCSCILFCMMYDVGQPATMTQWQWPWSCTTMTMAVIFMEIFYLLNQSDWVPPVNQKTPVLFNPWNW